MTATWSFDTVGAGVDSYINDLITSMALDQTFTWAPTANDFGFGAVTYRDSSSRVSSANDSLTSFTVAQVREPGTLTLFASGLIALGLIRRGRAS